jgi:hypothetical protein
MQQTLRTYLIPSSAAYEVWVCILWPVASKKSRKVLIGVQVVPVHDQHNVARKIEVV